MSGPATRKQIDILMGMYQEDMASTESLRTAAARLKEKAQEVARLAAENRVLTAENREWAGKLSTQSKDILFWTTTLVAISAIGQSAQIGMLIYDYVSRMYQLDKNKKQTEKTLGIVASGLDQLEGNAKKVAAYLLFLGASTAIGASALLGLVWRKTRSKK